MVMRCRVVGFKWNGGAALLRHMSCCQASALPGHYRGAPAPGHLLIKMHSAIPAAKLRGCVLPGAQVTKDCITSIANSDNFGGIYQEIFRACNVTAG